MITKTKLIIPALTVFLLLLFLGCTEQPTGRFISNFQHDGNFVRDRMPNDRNFTRCQSPIDGNFFAGEMPPQMQENIIIQLGLPENSSINDIKLYLGLQENSTNEELMQALKEKNIFGGRYRWKNIFLY